jgi:hypothetical protein
MDKECCPYCSNESFKVYHPGKCPKVKSIEYHENGTIKKVEFFEEMINGESRGSLQYSLPSLCQKQ